MVSDRAPFTVEANEECEEILNSVSHYITAQGKLIRSLGNEAYLTIFNMTIDTPAGGMASDDIKNELLNTKFEDFGCRKITKWFGYTADQKTKKISPPKYNHRDKVHLKAGECCNNWFWCIWINYGIMIIFLINSIYRNFAFGGFYCR